MERVVRAFPIKSRKALVRFAKDVDKYSSKKKSILKKKLGFKVEEWYYQKINGKPHVIAIAEGKKLEKGFKKWGKSKDPFARFFRKRVKKMTGYDLSKTPKGPDTELIYKMRA